MAPVTRNHVGYFHTTQRFCNTCNTFDFKARFCKPAFLKSSSQSQYWTLYPKVKGIRRNNSAKCIVRNAPAKSSNQNTEGRPTNNNTHLHVVDSFQNRLHWTQLLLKRESIASRHTPKLFIPKPNKRWVLNPETNKYFITFHLPQSELCAALQQSVILISNS